MQVPFWQVSVCVQPLPSEHSIPLGAFVGAEHCPLVGLQVPTTLHTPGAESAPKRVTSVD